MAKYNSPISVTDIKDKKTREALIIVLENCQYLKEKVDELKREIELLKRKAV
jgi:hypothetical protein